MERECRTHIVYPLHRNIRNTETTHTLSLVRVFFGSTPTNWGEATKKKIITKSYTKLTTVTLYSVSIHTAAGIYKFKANR